jgi:demethylmenaquinone methyltransferase/2-methoxy-6-polyprenyl-1,4-benzoquinol methylase
LDVCAGTHDFGMACIDRFPHAQITALDFSQAMLDAGTHKIEKKPYKGHFSPVCGDALNMPFENNTFDVVFCAYGVRNFDSAKSGIEEIKRVLKPSGQLIVLEFFRPTTFLSQIFHKTYGEHVLPFLGKWLSGHPSAYTYLRDSIRGFMSITEFDTLLQSTGFVNTSHKSLMGGISHIAGGFKK